jgi:hypothetical protein
LLTILQDRDDHGPNDPRCIRLAEAAAEALDAAKSDVAAVQFSYKLHNPDYIKKPFFLEPPEARLEVSDADKEKQVERSLLLGKVFVAVSEVCAAINMEYLANPYDDSGAVTLDPHYDILEVRDPTHPHAGLVGDLLVEWAGHELAYRVELMSKYDCVKGAGAKDAKKCMVNDLVAGYRAKYLQSAGKVWERVSAVNDSTLTPVAQAFRASGYDVAKTAAQFPRVRDALRDSWQRSKEDVAAVLYLVTYCKRNKWDGEGAGAGVGRFHSPSRSGASASATSSASASPTRQYSKPGQPASVTKREDKPSLSFCWNVCAQELHDLKERRMTDSGTQPPSLKILHSEAKLLCYA